MSLTVVGASGWDDHTEGPLDPAPQGSMPLSCSLHQELSSEASGLDGSLFEVPFHDIEN